MSQSFKEAADERVTNSIIRLRAFIREDGPALMIGAEVALLIDRLTMRYGAAVYDGLVKTQGERTKARMRLAEGFCPSCEGNKPRRLETGETECAECVIRLAERRPT